VRKDYIRKNEKAVLKRTEKGIFIAYILVLIL